MAKYGIKQTELIRICDKTGIALVTYYNRRRSGLTHEEAISIPKERPKYGDKSIAQQCKEWNISLSTYSSRRASGLSHDEALRRPVRNYTQRDTKRTILARCKDIGITQYTYNKRRQMGMSKEEALSVPRKITVKEQCHDAGITTSAYYKRRERGMSHEEALIMIIGIASTAAFVGGGTIVNDARVSTTVRDLGHFEPAITNALFDHPEAGTYTNNNLTGKIAAIVRDINNNLDDGEKIINPTTALTEEDSHGAIYINADIPDTGEYVILASEKKDPWGNPYYFIFDTSTRQVGTSQFHITVVSAGPNAAAEIGGIIDKDDVFLLDEQLNGRVYTAIYNCSEIDGFDEYDNNYVSALVGFPETYDGTASLRSATGQESLPVTGGGNTIPAAGNHELSNPMLTLTRSEGTITVNSTTTVNVDRQGTGALSVMSANTSVARARIEGSIVKITGVAEGTTTITVQCAETVQYLAGVAIYTATVKEGIIEKLTPAKPTLSPASLTLSVDGGSGNITVSHDGTGVVSAYSSPSGIVTTSVDGDTVSITPVKSGTATVTFLVAEDETYKATSAKATITILVSSCTVSFSSGAGSGSMDPVIVAKGSSYLLPANGFEAPDHMQFKAWSIGGVEYAAKTRYTVSEDVTAVAVWQGIKHTVTYNNGGGKGTKDSEQVAYNTVITLPASNTFVAQAHKQFKAWDVNGEEYSAGADYTITGNTTITAVWEYVKHTVSYANGGGGGTKANEVCGDSSLIPNSTDASGNPCVLFQTPNFQIYTKVSTNHVDWEGYTTLNIRANPYVEMPDSNRYADYGSLCVGLTTRGPGSTRGYGEGIATVATPSINENGVRWPIGQTFTASVDLPETNPGNLYFFIQQHRASAYIYEIWLE